MSKYAKSISLRLSKEQNRKLTKISKKYGKNASNTLRHLIDLYEDENIVSEILPEIKKKEVKNNPTKEKVNILNNSDKLELLKKFKIAKLNGIKDRD